jgi:hypothetical protein
MQFPMNSDDGGGFYSPQPLHYKNLPTLQTWINSTEGKLSIQDKDALHNLITQLPMLYAEGLSLAGETVLWLRRKTYGPRCPYFNEDDDQCSVSKCPICFNTGFINGYDYAVGLKMSFIPGRSDILIEQAGLTVTQRPTAWTIVTDPIMAEKDIIVTFSNERYEIHSAEAIEHQGRRHHQELTLSRIDRNDAKYYISTPGQNGQQFNDFPCGLIIESPHGVNLATTDLTVDNGEPNSQNYQAYLNYLPVNSNGQPFTSLRQMSNVYENMPGQNFPATIIIRNFYFNSEGN